MGTPTFSEVQIFKFQEGEGRDLGCAKQSENQNFTISFAPQSLLLTNTDDGNEYSRLPLNALLCCQLTERSVALRPSVSNCNVASLVLQFPDASAASSFRYTLTDAQTKLRGTESGQPDSSDKTTTSAFDRRTEEASAAQYFQFYGYLSQQQNMLQDYVRTTTYLRAILSNLGDFKDKVVLDVGAGSGILSFFAVQAGAARVYAVEASSMAGHCESLVRANRLENKIIVVSGKVEEVNLPEMVDVIVSEPMGYMLLNERMLESFLHAKKFLKPGGKMYPSRGDLHIAPFTDEALYLEQTSKASFWCQDSFHGVNLSNLRPAALKEYFKQPVVDTFHVGILMARSHTWSIDFTRINEQDLYEIDIPLRFVLQNTGHIHGLAFWFDVAFIGCSETVWLSTSPTESLTHWYQVRCLVERPILGKLGQVCTGRVQLHANNRQSYDVDIDIASDGKRSSNSLDLKNPCFRYGGQVVQPPPGSSTQSPTETYWANVTQTQQNSAAPLTPQTSSYDYLSMGGNAAAAMGAMGGQANLPMGNGTSNNGLGPIGSRVTMNANSSAGPSVSALPALASGGNPSSLMDLLFASQGQGSQTQLPMAGMVGGSRGGSFLPSSTRINSGSPVTSMGSGASITSLPLKISSAQGGNQQQGQHSLPFSSPAYPIWSVTNNEDGGDLLRQ